MKRNIVFLLLMLLACLCSSSRLTFALVGQQNSGLNAQEKRAKIGKKSLGLTKKHLLRNNCHYLSSD